MHNYLTHTFPYLRHVFWITLNPMIESMFDSWDLSKFIVSCVVLNFSILLILGSHFQNRNPSLQNLIYNLKNPSLRPSTNWMSYLFILREHQLPSLRRTPRVLYVDSKAAKYPNYTFSMCVFAKIEPNHFDFRFHRSSKGWSSQGLSFTIFLSESNPRTSYLRLLHRCKQPPPFAFSIDAMNAMWPMGKTCDEEVNLSKPKWKWMVCLTD